MVSSKVSVLVITAVLMAVATAKVAEGAETQDCVSNLVPCADYINSTKPPKSCCDPLKVAVTTQLACLCGLYSDPNILSTFKINRTQALLLPGYCGISGDLSACNGTAKSPSSSALPPPATAGNNDKGGVEKIIGSGFSSLLLLMAYLLFV